MQTGSRLGDGITGRRGFGVRTWVTLGAGSVCEMDDGDDDAGCDR